MEKYDYKAGGRIEPTTAQMKEVTKEEFYNIIKTEKLDVCVSVAGDYPFTNYFKFRDGRIFGVVKPTEINPEKYPHPWYKDQYFIY